MRIEYMFINIHVAIAVIEACIWVDRDRTEFVQFTDTTRAESIL
jgi:hypothetical protein